jgi:4-hydroxy-tetrahydrodipicolinate synthase
MKNPNQETPTMHDTTAANRPSRSPDQSKDRGQDRRTFLQTVGMLGLAAALPRAAAAADTPDVKGADLKTPSGKPLRGLYPIMETPFTADDKLNTDALAAEVQFLNRGRVNGMIWPVFASSWSALSDAERVAGAEAILAAGKGGKSAIAIAVQNMQWDIPTSVRYAKHAAAHGADAIVAIPPNNGWNVTDDAVLDYYKTIAAATDRPLIVQTRGTMSVDLMLKMFQQIPTMKATKDEVGDTLARAPELIKGTDNKLAVWAAGGGTGAQLMENLPLGIVGLCPTPQYAELLQQAMDLYWVGKKRESFDMFSRVQGFATIPGATEYMMVARGVFPEGTKSRPQPMEPEARQGGRGAGGAGGGGGAAAGGGGAGAGGGRAAAAPLTDKAKENIRNALDVYLKPYLRG